MQKNTEVNNKKKIKKTNKFKNLLPPVSNVRNKKIKLVVSNIRKSIVK